MLIFGEFIVIPKNSAETVQVPKFGRNCPGTEILPNLSSCRNSAETVQVPKFCRNCPGAEILPKLSRQRNSAETCFHLSLIPKIYDSLKWGLFVAQSSTLPNAGLRCHPLVFSIWIWCVCSPPLVQSKTVLPGGVQMSMQELLLPGQLWI